MVSNKVTFYFPGFGGSCVYMTSHCLCGLYYEKYRSIATGVATSGSGLGGALMPVLAGWLIDVYSWKGALVILAGICLHLVVFSMLLVMPPPHSKALSKNSENESYEKKGLIKLEDPQFVTNKPQEIDNLDVSFLPVKENIDSNLQIPSDHLIDDVNCKKENEQRPKTAKHIYIFTSFSFNVYFVSNILWSAADAINTTFIPEFLRESGLTPIEASWMFGVFGTGVFIGGLLGGLIGNVKCVNRLILYFAANVCMGTLMVIFPNFHNVVFYATILLIAGFSFGILIALFVVVLTDLVGTESIENGLGFLMFANGVGAFIGPPIAGESFTFVTKLNDANNAILLYSISILPL